MFLFEEFNDDNTNQDTRVRDRNKVLKDIISDQSRNGTKSENSYWEEYLWETRPELQKIVENVKSGQEKPSAKNYELEDADEELDKIFEGEISFQSLSNLNLSDNSKKFIEFNNYK